VLARSLHPPRCFIFFCCAPSHCAQRAFPNSRFLIFFLDSPLPFVPAVEFAGGIQFYSMRAVQSQESLSSSVEIFFCCSDSIVASVKFLSVSLDFIPLWNDPRRAEFLESIQLPTMLFEIGVEPSSWIPFDLFLSDRWHFLEPGFFRDVFVFGVSENADLPAPIAFGMLTKQVQFAFSFCVSRWVCPVPDRQALPWTLFVLGTVKLTRPLYFCTPILLLCIIVNSFFPAGVLSLHADSHNSG